MNRTACALQRTPFAAPVESGLDAFTHDQIEARIY